MYNYETEKPRLFTEQGQRQFLEIRDKVHALLKSAMAFRLDSVMSGDTWRAMACVDRMVELGEIIEIPQTDVAGQHRVFVEN